MTSATGRTRSDKPALQNIPIRTVEARELRDAVQAWLEETFVEDADFGSIEQRMFEHLEKQKGA